MSASLLPDRITPLTQAEFSETHGGTLVCCMVSLPIFGISLLQAYIYYLNYPRDNKWLKTMVALLLFFESTLTWMGCQSVYHYLILGYSNPLSLIDGDWSVYVANALGIPICFLIQIYFSRMVYLLAKKKWKVTAVIIFGVLIIGQIVFGIYAVVKFFVLWELPKLKAVVYPALVPLYSTRVVSDTLTAVALCIVLYDASTHSVFKGSSNLFKTLMIYAMNRFILTTVVVVIQTCVLIAKPGSLWAMAMDAITPHLYVNSLLATLNARKKLREIGPPGYNNQESMFASASRYIGSTQAADRTESSGKPSVNLFLGKRGNDGGVRIDQETFTMPEISDDGLTNKVSVSDLA
ncbi:hypothetical protein B0H16DRAFT_1505210 [Mycena metata]|uniref:DUF6534 domain-containing protein n=1 Tax=Mycena metata TaxID=1033252 RepID=A0AAD7K3B5_9AGAR|nr:hypothetical protein B0H16DRAFT_1505210 [Mycena metata]